jgi:hypothetical protein
MALKPDDVQRWNDVVRALAPTVGMGIDAVLGLIRLVRRTEGKPEVQPGDEKLAGEVVASLTKAQTPFQQVVNTANQELKD